MTFTVAANYWTFKRMITSSSLYWSLEQTCAQKMSLYIYCTYGQFSKHWPSKTWQENGFIYHTVTSFFNTCLQHPHENPFFICNFSSFQWFSCMHIFPFFINNEHQIQKFNSVYDRYIFLYGEVIPVGFCFTCHTPVNRAAKPNSSTLSYTAT